MTWSLSGYIGMEEHQHYLFISSTDSIGIYTTNQPYDFTVVLPKPLNLYTGVWKCALLNTSFHPGHSGLRSMVITCDLVRHSYFHGCILPVLDVAFQAKKKNTSTTGSSSRQVVDFVHPLYHQLNRSIVNTFRMRVKEADTLLECTHLSETFSCVLHLKRE